MKFRCVAVILSLLFSANSFADDKQSAFIQASSSWTNQSGSTLNIDNVDNNGMLTGTYINRESGYRCQNISYPVTGWVYGTAITFTTIWESNSESCNSITAWTGFYYDGKINTLWQLTINGSTDPSQILKGKDVFKSSIILESKSLILKK